MPPRHPHIAQALGLVRRRLVGLGAQPRPVAVHVACSGGPDSVALLGLLHRLAHAEGLTLTVGHVDHGLREASAAEAALVQRVGASLGLPVAVTRLLHLRRGAGLPARARAARRAALLEQARDAGAPFVALGHTATDQAETMLLHLSRGAALAGLSAMSELDRWPEGPAGGVLRPLLDLTRDRARALAERLELPFVDDPTNHDAAHPRVRVRHEVLPRLRALNPRLEEALARTAAHAREAEDALAHWVDALLRSRRRPITPAGGSTHDVSAHAGVPDESPGPASRWSIDGVDQLPRAVRTRFVRRICRDAGAPEDALPARTLASIDEALLRPGPPRSWNLHPCLRLRVVHGELWVEPAAAADGASNH